MKYYLLIGCRKTKEMRQKHNLISQRGRKKINDEIKRLKNVIPECKNIECNKAFILSKAVKYIEDLQHENYALYISHQNMEKQFEDLWLKYQSAINQEQYDFKNKSEQNEIVEKEQLEAIPQYYEQIEEMEFIRPPKRKRNHEDSENNWELY